MLVVRNGVIAVVVTTLAIAGCANNPPGSGTESNSDCNPAFAAGVGAILGGLLANGNNRVRGAALGAGIGSLACLAWNYHSKQTKTADQIQREYRAANRGSLPAESQIVRYDTRFDPTNRISPGGQLTIASNIEVIQGRSDHSSPLVEEEIVLVKPDGSEVRSRKPANEGLGAGGYQSRFTMTMPLGVQQGIYPVRTALYVNGRRADEKSLSLQVVVADAARQLASMEPSEQSPN